MQLIGLHGRAGAGKDTIATYLEEAHGFLRWGFGDPLYNEVNAAFGTRLLRRELTQEDKEVARPELALENCADGNFVDVALEKLVRSDALQYAETWAKQPLTLRWVLQVWGTEYRRGSNDRYWIEQADLFIRGFLETLKVFDKGGKLMGYRNVAGLVCIDMRFQNERELIEEYSGQVWHVRRDTTSIFDSISAAHASEQPLPLRTGDKLILNNSTIERLNTGVQLALLGNDIVNTEE